MDKQKNQQEIENLLLSTQRIGMHNLIAEMNFNGFFEAPCSTKYHLHVEGGLAQHSLNVYRTMKELCESFAIGTEITEDNIIICSLLHDLGKMGDYGKKLYVPNYVRSKSKNKETGEYDQVISEAQPYTHNPDLMGEEHEIKSVLIAERFINLSEEEESAILHHNGLFGKLDSSYGTQLYAKTKLAFLLHTADMYVSRFVEE